MVLRLQYFLRQVRDVFRNVASSQKICQLITERVTVVIKQMVAVTAVHHSPTHNLYWN